MVFSKDMIALLFCPESRVGVVTIPDGVESIGENAFGNCGDITGIIIPDSVTDKGSGAFGFCFSLLSLTIPDGVTELHSPFDFCESLQEVTFGSGVYDASLRDWFTYCPSIQNVNFSADNPYFASVDGVVFSKDRSGLCYFPAGRQVDTYNIPRGTTWVDNFAFMCCGVGHVTIPDSVMSIGVCAFEGCGISSVSSS